MRSSSQNLLVTEQQLDCSLAVGTKGDEWTDCFYSEFDHSLASSLESSMQPNMHPDFRSQQPVQSRGATNVS